MLRILRLAFVLTLGACCAVCNAQLALEWQQRIGRELPCNTAIKSSAVCADQSIVVTGIKHSGNEYHAFAAKLALDGRVVWEQRFGLIEVNVANAGQSFPVHVLESGDVIVAFSGLLTNPPRTSYVVARLDGPTGLVEWRSQPQVGYLINDEILREVIVEEPYVAVTNGRQVRVLRSSTGELLHDLTFGPIPHEGDYKGLVVGTESDLYLRKSMSGRHTETYYRVDLATGLLRWSTTVPADVSFYDPHFMVLTGSRLCVLSLRQIPGSGGYNYKSLLYFIDAGSGSIRATVDTPAIGEGGKVPVGAVASGPAKVAVLWRVVVGGVESTLLEEYVMANGHRTRARMLPEIDASMYFVPSGVLEGDRGYFYLRSWDRRRVFRLSLNNLSVQWRYEIDGQVSVDNRHRISSSTARLENEPEQVFEVDRRDGSTLSSITLQQVGPVVDTCHRFVANDYGPLLFSVSGDESFSDRFDATTGARRSLNANWSETSFGLLPSAFSDGTAFMHFYGPQFEDRFRFVERSGVAWEVPLTGGQVKAAHRNAAGATYVVATGQAMQGRLDKFSAPGKLAWSASSAEGILRFEVPLLEVAGRVVACLQDWPVNKVSVYSSSNGLLERTVELVPPPQSSGMSLRHWFVAPNGALIGCAIVESFTSLPYYQVFRFDPATGLVTNLVQLLDFNMQAFEPHPQEAVMAGSTILIGGSFKGGNVAAIDANTGLLMWVRPSANFPFRVFADGNGFGYCYERTEYPAVQLVKFDLLSGASIWQIPLALGHWDSPPFVDVARDGSIYMARNVSSFELGRDITVSKFRQVP